MMEEIAGMHRRIGKIDPDCRQILFIPDPRNRLR
jgi:hypothetical protein